MKKVTLFLAALWLFGCSGAITQPADDKPLTAQANGQIRPISEEEPSYLMVTPFGVFETTDDPTLTYPEELASDWSTYALNTEQPHFSRLVWNGGDYYWEVVPILNQR